MAMELYIALLSDQIPGWLEDNAPVCSLCICLFPNFSFYILWKYIFYFLLLQRGSEPDSLGGGKTSNPQHDLSILPLHQPNSTSER